MLKQAERLLDPVTRLQHRSHNLVRLIMPILLVGDGACGVNGAYDIAYLSC